MIEEFAKKFQSQLSYLLDNLPDSEKIKVPDLFPRWSSASMIYQKNFIVNYEGLLYKSLQDHISDKENDPFTEPLYWELLKI